MNLFFLSFILLTMCLVAMAGAWIAARGSYSAEKLAAQNSFIGFLYVIAFICAVFWFCVLWRYIWIAWG